MCLFLRWRERLLRVRVSLCGSNSFPTFHSASSQPSGLRLLHPLRGLRIGEALQPGPSSRSRSPAPRSRSLPPAVSSSSSGPGDLPPDSQDPQDHLPPITFTIAAGRPGTLSCFFMRKARTWRWSVGSGQTRKVAESHLGPRAALQTWLDRHGRDLTDGALADIQTGLALLPASPLVSGSAPASTAAATTTPPSMPHGPLGSVIPTEQECARLYPADVQHLLAAATPTQRRLPPSALQGVVRALADLHRISTDAQLGASQQRLATLLILTAPRWLWPEPSRSSGTCLGSHARPKLIHARLHLLHRGDWPALLNWAPLHPLGLCSHGRRSSS